jgi:hypothetical protein
VLRRRRWGVCGCEMHGEANSSLNVSFAVR